MPTTRKKQQQQSKGKLPEPPRPFREFTDRHPDVAHAYESLGTAVRGAGPLSEREIALIKLGISLGARLEGAAHAHARKALAAGIDAATLRHVAILTVPTLGFPTMMASLGWVEDVVAGKPRKR